MKTKSLFLSAALMAVMLLPLWQNSKVMAGGYEPADKYAKFIRRFSVDKAWEFENAESNTGGEVGNGARLAECPGFIAWELFTWNKGTNNDDHQMLHFRLYLSNTANHSKKMYVTEIIVNDHWKDDDWSDYNGTPQSISNEAHFDNWCVQVRHPSEPYQFYYAYIMTKFDDEARKFIQEQGNKLCLYIETRYDNGHMTDYAEYSTALDADDRKLFSYDMSVNSTSSWMEDKNNGKTAIKYTRNMPEKSQLRITESNSGKTIMDWKSVNAGQEDAYLYLSDVGTPKTVLSPGNEQALKYSFQARRTFSYSQSYYSYHGTTSSCPSSNTIYSTAVTLTPPAFAQPKIRKVEVPGDGTVILTWNVSSTSGDQSNFIVERSPYEDFKKEITSTTVTFQSSQKEYSFTDNFKERNQGTLKLYYRLHREHASVSELGFTQTKEVNTNYKAASSMSLTSIDDKVQIDWKMDNGIWTPDMSLQVLCNGQVLKTFTKLPSPLQYKTEQSLPSCEELNFALAVMENGTERSRLSNKEPITLSPREIGTIDSVQPSCGYFNDHVTVRWKTNEKENNFNYFRVFRNEYGISDATPELLGTVESMAGVTEYSYDDRTAVPGVYYLYSVRGYSSCGDKVTMQSNVNGIGFAQPFGVVSGQITYNGNQGVPGVAVHAIGDDTRRGYSLYFKDESSVIKIPKEMLNRLVTEEEGTFELFIKQANSTEHDGGFYHHVVTYKNGIYTTYINGVPREGDTRWPGWFFKYGQDWEFRIWDSKKCGWIDEIRFWNICRDSADIVRTMNSYLNGAERGLTGYYRCDDNVPGYLFDISRKGTTYNGNHLTIENIDFDEANLPTTEQLSLRNYTDEDGNYLITNIPYTVDGSLYKIIPTLGIHKFSPTSRPLFFNGDASTHNSVDFTDESSFPVSGTVYYEGTDYPVAGCNFYVDGTACVANNNIVESAEDGTFTISVPIGKHYIEVRKANHTFVYGGYYPEPVGDEPALFDFQEPISNLTFYDNTLVTLTGRIAGGTDQQALPHGMQQGKANIGQAHIVLSPEIKERYNLNTDAVNQRQWGKPEECFSVGSNAVTEANQSTSRSKYIYIDTDPVTGEFSVLLPPIDMTVDEISLPHNPDVDFTDYIGAIGKLELSKAGENNLTTDSMLVDSVNYRYFSYTACLDVIHREKPQLLLTDAEHTDGMMGIRQHLIQDNKMDTSYIVDIYEYDSLAAAWKYNYEVPYFLQGNTYVWHLRAFEQYINKDNTDWRFDSVPIRGGVVTLYNQLGDHLVIDKDTVIMSSTGDSIVYTAGDIALESNQVQLDSLTGCAYYQFNAGDPLVTAPYRLGLTISYTNAEGTANYDWDHNADFQGVVLGAVSNGTNFVTEGPDRVIYVLRDPPGSESFATLKKGTEVKNSTFDNNTWYASGGVQTVTNFGLKVTVGFGPMGLTEITESKVKDKLHVEGEGHGGGTHEHTWKTTSVTTRDISTSSDIWHVGPSGDVYIGYTTNRTFGEATEVTLLRDSSGNYDLGTRQVIGVGEQYDTEFSLSQLDIETQQIPNFIKLRNALLETVSQAEYDKYQSLDSCPGTESRYITTLTPDSPKFGQDSTTYKFLYPEQTEPGVYQDMVAYYNNQINTWKMRLADNEQSKVNAIAGTSGSKLERNVTVDGGVVFKESATSTYDTTFVHSRTQGGYVIAKNTFGFCINETGVTTTLYTKDGDDKVSGGSSQQTATTTIEYTIKLKPFEQLSVNIYNANDGNSPVFETVGGQTVCPYEGEEKTKYLDPGEHVLSVATQRMEDPLIRVESPSAYSAIPVGGSATYTIEMTNVSVVPSPTEFRLRLMEDSNPDGAQILVEGSPLNAGGVHYNMVGNNIVTKTVVLKQGRPDVLEYKNIGLILSSDCEEIITADTAYISATFVAACSDINLTTDTRIVNSDRGGKLAMTVNGYDVNLPTLTGCRLQYKQPSQNTWQLIKEFDKTAMADGSVHYTWDMNSLSDGTYEVRAITVCDLGGEVYNESEVITVVKDLASPAALGLPSPINGIYTVDNQIYVDFNEDIQVGRITNTCVDVNGVLNAHEIEHSVGLLYNMQTSYTTAEYDLSNTSFAFETYINYSQPGYILFHSMQGLQLEITEEGHLRVILDSLEWISTTSIPKDEWVYFLFNYTVNDDNTGGTMSAYCAYGDEEVTLFSSQPMPLYDRRGPVFVAYPMLVAKMHDAVLWGKSRDWATALSERDKTKDPYTEGILSYWPMDEGTGPVAHDIIRHRDLTLYSSQMWWFGNENKALHIPAGAEAVMDFTRFPDSFGDDYVFSFWFRTAAQGETPFFRTSNGTLVLSLDGNTLIVQTKAGTNRLDMGSRLNDGTWHHFALSSSHSFSPVILLDGMVRNIATMDRQVFVTNALCFSDTLATADMDIDEVQLWKANCSTDYIVSMYRNQLRGNEPGLRAYFPMQEVTVDGYGQNVTRFTMADKQTNDPDHAADMYLSNKQGNIDAAEAPTVPPIREARPIETVQHNYTASERRIVINITEQARRIEGCTLNLSVKDIVDANGNYCDPINWSVYVNRNQLLWEEPSVRVVKDALNDTTIQVTILNNSGKTENWSLANVPEWLTFSEYGGVLQPLASKTLTATISSALAIGNNAVSVYLVGNEGINQPLYLTVKVNAGKPDWHINSADFELSMNMIASATVNGIVADDSEDMVAAFINGQIAGIGHPQFVPAYNTYLIMMDIYANSASPVTFSYWDASTGITYNKMDIQMSRTDTKHQTMDFLSGQLVGQPNNPVRLSTNTSVEQTIDLVKGWNWISFNVLPDDNHFGNLLGNTKEHLSLIKSRTAYAQTDASHALVGSLTEMDVRQAYKTNMNEPCQLTISGKVTNPLQYGIELAANGWSWIGYLPQTVLSVNAALANLTPVKGDIIKARSGFAMWDGYQWIGSLTAMAPGNGYLYYNSGSDAMLYYPSMGSLLFAPQRVKQQFVNQTLTFTPVTPTKYQGNMTVTAVVMDGDQIVDDAEVGIFAGDECRAAAVQHDGYWFLTIPGDGSTELTIRVAIEGKIKEVTQTLTYVDDAVVGLPDAPYIIQLDAETGLDYLPYNENSGYFGGKTWNKYFKFVKNGLLYIRRCGKTYNAVGMEL
ncbi:MAG: laminin G domain-containing protein [Paludibacteraceae bacterium]|nr:laminin G domain-containing protein [Paludibacteraceae bacterium]